MGDMMPETEIIKTEINALKRMMDRFDQKLDSLVALQIQMVELRGDHGATKAGLERAFDAIDNIKHQQASTGKLLNKIMGGAIAAAVLIGVVQWFLLRELQEYDNMKKDVNSMSRRLDKISDSLIITKGKENAVYPSKQE